MLSASTISSSSSAYSSNAGMSTPSQYSSDSRRGNGNPLTELIETEQSYIETLKMIDSQIAPIWMKQMTSAAPDFSELLKYIHDILKVNKRFCLKLNKIASNPQAISELGDVLMQWVNDFEVPYANYSRSYIPNLNQRSDILRNASIHSLLANLSANVSYDINLETLFNSPLKQLRYYKGLYSRLLESTDSGRADHKLLLNANKRIDMMMAMAKNNTPNKPVANKMMDNNLPPIQTNFNPQSDLTTFERQVDCSRTVDLYGGAQINYQLNIANPGIQLVMRDNFIMLPAEANGSTIRAHLLLTTEALVVCRELSSNRYLLIYPAIPIGDITVKAESIDRELVGEYIIRFSVLGKKHIIMRANSKEIRNTWIGVDLDSSNSAITTPRTLSVAAQKKMLSTGIGSNKYAAIELKPAGNNNSSRNTDIYNFYSENTEETKKTGKSRDTIMDIYDNHFFESDDEAVPPPPPVNINPQSVKILPHVPNVPQAQQFFNNGPIPTHTPNKDRPNVKQTLPPIPPNKQQPSVSPPVKDFSHVQMTYIQAPTAQMSSMSISPPIQPNNESKFISSSSSFPLNNNNLSPSSPDRSFGIKSNMNDSKPSSPRAIEVQRAVIPEVMQAVTQKTDEYISDNRMQIPRTSSIRGPNTQHNQAHPPRNQSQNQQQQQQQQRPMQQNGYSPNPQSRQMMPQQQQQQQQQQQRPPQHYQQQQQQQQYQQRPGPPGQPMNYNNSRPIPSPTLSPNVSSNTARRPPGGQPSSSPRLQQPAGRFISPSPSMSNLQAHGSSEELNSPPDSPNAYNSGNEIRQVLYSNSQCDVFHWNKQSWYAADGQCLLQVKVTHSNRACVAVQLQNTGQLYLNAWILPTTVIRSPSPTDVSISVYMGTNKENYLIHFAHPQDANVFANILRNAHAQSNQPPPPLPIMHEPEHEEPEREPVDNVNVPQTLKPVMQCKAKLFIQNETSNWSTFGSVTMRISQQAPSMRMLIQIENDKTKLVSAVVRSGNVEMITAKRISFLLVDEVQKTSIVYMIHLREDQTGKKIFEYLRTKNAENGW